MRPYQMNPEKRRELSKIVSIFNFSPVDFTRKVEKETYRIKARTIRDLPMSFAYLWFGNPSLRSDESRAHAGLWDKHVRQLGHKYMRGDEKGFTDSFFHKYILTGQIGCVEILQKFVADSGIHIDPSLSDDEQRALVARAYYGKAMIEDHKINDGGRSLDLADLVMFSTRRLPPGEQVREVSDAEVKSATASIFGTSKTPTTGIGTSAIDGGLLSSSESHGLFSAVALGAS